LLKNRHRNTDMPDAYGLASNTTSRRLSHWVASPMGYSLVYLNR